MRCVPAHHFTVAKALAWRSAIEERPPYQRESAVWSLEKQQLFIDSLLNGYDVPKIYLHDLRGEEPTKVYSIVDGKQRLTAIWEFLADEFPLAPDFRVEPANLPDLPTGAVAPVGGLRFSELDRAWQGALRDTYLSVVLIRNATEDDIEELFSRLNNGEPLNAAEKRNAMGGDMVRLIREVAHRPFFTERLYFSNGRHQHYDLAARLLVLTDADLRGEPELPDLRNPALDAFVRIHRRLADPDRDALLGALDARLAVLEATFGPADPLLGSPAQALLHAVFVDDVARRGAPDAPGPTRDAAGPARVEAGAAIREFLDEFQRNRLAALEQAEGERDETYVEFSELMQHAVNDPRNLRRRLAILERAHERWRSGSAAMAGSSR
ncbi:MAG: DUF262 domain-containing protein [Chloroflexota bacterium]